MSVSREVRVEITRSRDQPSLQDKYDMYSLLTHSVSIQIHTVSLNTDPISHYFFREPLIVGAAGFAKTYVIMVTCIVDKGTH